MKRFPDVILLSRRLGQLGACALTCLWTLPNVAVCQEQVTASVKRLSEPAQAAPDAMARPDADASPVVTLPGQRLPQYQTKYSRVRALQSDQSEGTLLVLDIPTLSAKLGRPLLLSLKFELNKASLEDAHQQRLASMLSSQLLDENSGTQDQAHPSAVDDQENEDVNESRRPVDEFLVDKEVNSELTSDEEFNQSEAATEDGSKTSVDDAPQADSDQNEELAAEPVLEYRLTTRPDELAQRYAAATGLSIEKAEAEWLLSHWSKGPQLLMLRPYFQSFRGAERPAFRVLDRNEDGQLSPQEINEASQTLRRCDSNRDEVVDLMEVASAGLRSVEEANDRKDRTRILWTLAELRQIPMLEAYASLAIRSLDRDHDGFFDEKDCNQLRTMDRDVEILVSFDRDSPDVSKITAKLLNTDSNFSLKESTLLYGIELESQFQSLNFCAVQASWSDQVSVGAVSDGYPLLPELDPNDDGRLTIRELRNVGERILAYDRNQDGVLELDEVQAPIRICFGLGATVHQELASIRSRKTTSAAGNVVPPAWFGTMDRNGDGDLTRSEFPGTDEQYESLDSDGDDLISAQEALSFDKMDRQ